MLTGLGSGSASTSQRHNLMFVQTRTSIFSQNCVFPVLQSELIVSKGYPCDDYTVQTEDGFLIGLQRIRHGLGEEDARRGNEEKKPVVFLQHGLLCSSTNWLTNLVNESFGENRHSASTLSLGFLKLTFLVITILTGWYELKKNNREVKIEEQKSLALRYNLIGR